MIPVLYGLIALIGLATFVCYILVVVQMFKHQKTGWGVASIITLFCGIGYPLTLIYGWVKAGEWRIQKLMTAYTALFVLLLGLYGYMIATVLPQQMQEFQRQMDAQKKQIDAQQKPQLDMPVPSPDSTIPAPSPDATAPTPSPDATAPTPSPDATTPEPK